MGLAHSLSSKVGGVVAELREAELAAQRAKQQRQEEASRAAVLAGGQAAAAAAEGEPAAGAASGAGPGACGPPAPEDAPMGDAELDSATTEELRDCLEA
eukprot:8989870-Pyramimonas_sp.AAC.1